MSAASARTPASVVTLLDPIVFARDPQSTCETPDALLAPLHIQFFLRFRSVRNRGFLWSLRPAHLRPVARQSIFAERRLRTSQ